MSDPPLFSGSPNHEDAIRKPLASDDLLPPVKPPSATFLIQLFLIPGVIVLVIVVLWMLLSGVLFRRSDPRELIKGLESSSATRWQKALELADVLRTSGDKYAKFKQDKNAASQLASVLERDLDKGPPVGEFKREEAMFRFFLSRCLGHFYVDDAIPVLLKVATTERNEDERIVRRGAIQAIARLSANMQQVDSAWPRHQEDVEAVLLRMSEEENEQIRSDAAFALGIFGTARARDRLVLMLDDPCAEARYNAAVALAKQGDGRAVEVLTEMLDYEEDAGLRHEKMQFKVGKRYRVMVNALEAVQELQNKSPDTDFDMVIEVLTALVEADPGTLEEHFVLREVVSAARTTLEALRAP